MTDRHTAENSLCLLGSNFREVFFCLIFSTLVLGHLFHRNHIIYTSGLLASQCGPCPLGCPWALSLPLPLDLPPLLSFYSLPPLPAHSLLSSSHRLPALTLSLTQGPGVSVLSRGAVRTPGKRQHWPVHLLPSSSPCAGQEQALRNEAVRQSLRSGSLPSPLPAGPLCVPSTCALRSSTRSLSVGGGCGSS